MDKDAKKRELTQKKFIKISNIMRKLSALLFCFLISMGIYAQDKKEKKESNDPVVSAIVLAGQLANYGQKNKDPFSLISVTKILLKYTKAGAVDFIEDGKETKGNEASSNIKKSKGVELDPTKLLASAKTMTDDKNLLAMVDDLGKQIPKNKQVTRGLVGGAVYTSRTVSGYSSYSFSCTFRGGGYAEMQLVGDGDTDLDFYVYDSSGSLVGSNENYDDFALFYWTPRYTETYTFKVVNRGRVYNKFRIITN